MNSPDDDPKSTSYWPLGQLILVRFREFIREPEAIFWVYGFPILITLALGFAFRNKPIEQIHVAIQAEADRKTEVDRIVQSLQSNPVFAVSSLTEADCRRQLRTGRSDLVIQPGDGGTVSYLFDPTRAESVLARNKVDDSLQRSAGRKDPIAATDHPFEEIGGRYIDFLIPGLIGMSLMGGGLWGVGYGTVDLRIRKVLKRFLATPMRKSDFLLSILISRLIFLVPEVIAILLFAHLVFGVAIQGSWLSMAFLILLGALMFAGIGLLVACRANTLETVSGLMNLVMLPMYVLSGIFFSSDRFPSAIQSLIQILPLTPLIQALRNISQEGASFISQWPQCSIMTAWAIVSFILALRWFRWN